MAAPQVSCGAVWSLEQIGNLKKLIESEGLIWSIAHKLTVNGTVGNGGQNTDKVIANVIESLANLGEANITTVCYDFSASDNLCNNTNRLQEVKENIKYFLTQLMPVCEEYNIHISYTPEYESSIPELERILNSVDNPYNGFTFNINTGNKIFDFDPKFIRNYISRMQLLQINCTQFDSGKQLILNNLVKMIEKENPSLPVLLEFSSPQQAENIIVALRKCGFPIPDNEP